MNYLVCLAAAAATLVGVCNLSAQAQAPGAEYGLPVASQTRVATHYRLPDGSLRAVLTVKPHNYQDSDGNWHVIDETLKRDVEYAYKNLENGLTSRFPDALADGIRFAGHNQPAVTLRPAQLVGYAADGSVLNAVTPWRAFAQQEGDKTVFYPGLYNGVTDEYVLGPDMVKHNMVVYRNGLAGYEASEFVAGEYMLDMPAGWSAQASNRKLRLLNEFGECIYEVGAVDAFDAAGEVFNGDLTWRLDGTVLHLGMKVSTAWLLDAQRQWPVRIDPTLTLQPDGTVGKDALLYSGGGNFGTYEFMTFNSGGDTEGIIEYNLSSMPSGATVTAAQFEAWHLYNTITGHVVNLYTASAAWVESTIAWSTKPARSATQSSSLTFTNGSPNVWRIWTGLGTLVASWLNSSVANNGFYIVNTTNSVFVAYLRSSDWTTATERPKLVIDYSNTPPSVTSVSPNPVSWSQTLTITGTSLTGATAVTIGGVAAAITSNTATQIEVTVADTTPTGSGRVVSVTTGSGSDSTQTVTVNGAAPVLTSGAPNPVSWLQTLTITGSNLSSTTAVSIGGTAAAITATTATTVQVTVSDSTATGSQTVAVTNSIGTTSTLSVTVSGVAPTVTGLAPDPVDWGQTLTITGNYLASTSAVTVGGTAAAITSASTTSVQVTVANNTPTGSQVVSVTTSGGNNSANSVTVNSVAPVIATVSPNPVSWLQTLTITGTFLSNATAVTVGGTAAAITSNTATQVQVTVADGTPTGSQNVVVTTAVGNSNTQSVTVNSVAPVATSAAPDPVNWSQQLTITGNYLATTSSVTIGGVTQALGTVSTTSVQVTVDFSTPTGSQTIVVTTSGGANNTLSVTVNALPPAITTATPNPVRWYQALTITGTGLGSATSVTVGGVSLTPQSNTMTQIVVNIPDTMATGVQTVQVTTAHGSDSTSVTVNGAPPVTTNVSPGSVMQGQSITITGTGLGNATVAVGGANAQITSNSMTQIVASITGFTPAGTHAVNVTTAHGTANNLTLTVTSASVTGGAGGGGGGGGGGCASSTGGATWMLGVLALLACAAVLRRRRAGA